MLAHKAITANDTCKEFDTLGVHMFAERKLVSFFLFYASLQLK